MKNKKRYNHKKNAIISLFTVLNLRFKNQCVKFYIFLRKCKNVEKSYKKI